MDRYRFVAKHLRTLKKQSYLVKSKVILYSSAMVTWHFTMIPVKISRDIKKNFGSRARGWGSLPVGVTLGKTSWNTSIFPDKKAGAYILPLKAEVRKKENIKHGDRISFRLEI